MSRMGLEPSPPNIDPLSYRPPQGVEEWWPSRSLSFCKQAKEWSGLGNLYYRSAHQP